MRKMITGDILMGRKWLLVLHCLTQPPGYFSVGFRSSTQRNPVGARLIDKRNPDRQIKYHVNPVDSGKNF